MLYRTCYSERQNRGVTTHKHARALKTPVVAHSMSNSPEPPIPIPIPIPSTSLSSPLSPSRQIANPPRCMRESQGAGTGAFVFARKPPRLWCIVPVTATLLTEPIFGSWFVNSRSRQVRITQHANVTGQRSTNSDVLRDISFHHETYGAVCTRTGPAGGHERRSR